MTDKKTDAQEGQFTYAPTLPHRKGKPRMKSVSVTGSHKLLEEMGELQAALSKLLLLERTADKNGTGEISRKRKKKIKRFRKLVRKEMIDVIAAMTGVHLDNGMQLTGKRMKVKRKRIKRLIRIGKRANVIQDHTDVPSTHVGSTTVM